jgi:predicted alpha-1,2-mannosidase
MSMHTSANLLAAAIVVVTVAACANAPSTGSNGADSNGGPASASSGSGDGTAGATSASSGTSGSSSGSDSMSSTGGSASGSSGGTSTGSGSSGSSSGAGDAGLPQLTTLVNPLIGTLDGSNPSLGLGFSVGDTFPGATCPLGMVAFSPDTPTNLPGGYYYKDTTIKDFSLTHFSGRGCVAEQDFPMMPFVGDVTSATFGTYASTYSHADETAEPGYYKVLLDAPNVTVELTATPHTGFARFTYPATTKAALVIDTAGSINKVTASSVTIDGIGGEVSGSATSPVGCGTGQYTIYFSAKFDTPFTSFGTWNGSALSDGSTTSSGTQSGAYLTFDTTHKETVLARVGVSYVSVANARANLAVENPGLDFDAVRAAADAAWNARLALVQVQGGTHADQIAFYTAMYHAFFHPNLFSDANGQYMGFDGMVHTVPAGHAQYQNVPGWDHYRTAAQLKAILIPAEASDIAQSLVNDAQQGDGHVPRWEQQAVDSHGMNGDHGSTYIADTMAFGVTDFDTAGAFTAMDQYQSKIREGLSDYTSLGCVAATTTGNSAAITLEYSIADFAIGQVAATTGETAKAAMYGTRAQNWANVFDTTSGYVQPKNSDGTWATGFQPTSDTGFQEGDSAQYSWEVPFNLAGLIAQMGGKASAVKRLDTFFTKLNDGPNSTYAFLGNEPCVGIPWVYDFAGAPSHTQSTVRQIQLTQWPADPSGIPGNDDGGAMSSWYVFSALGIYPAIPGLGGFVIGSPLFPSATVQLAGGKTLQIHAPAAQDNAPFVQSMLVNGTPTTSLWLPWSTVAAGATLEFDLGTTPSNWGTGPADAPPSFSQ